VKSDQARPPVAALPTLAHDVMGLVPGASVVAAFHQVAKRRRGRT
jgi:hypothetical protein